MKTYYHINKNEQCSWKVGDEFELGSAENHFWSSFAEAGDSIDLNGSVYDVHLIAKTAFNAYVKNEPVPVQMKGYHFNPLRTLQETLDSLGNSLKICRELSFEAIRREFYPELPSRLRCIWLIPDNNASLEFWRNVLPNGHQRIFKVAIPESRAVKIHRAAQKWLIGGTFSLKRWNELAHSYWKGEDSGAGDDEVLFEGKFKIIEEII